ncbi:flavocytochrome c [Liquorilactobacillus mali]|uniref:flavocytochrome c n=1 Tax=Liquorilactobacillus mali TaxID=1618 RepID=UPI00234FB74C|nr:flavocytochrome c [Liquorilactobacillus mali]MDC7954126.1 flavocytochrome c [Liquorilactobacillus mali]
MADKFVFTPSPIKQLGTDYDVIIIGSGSTGLTCAIQAYELGLKPVILEKMDKIGGNTNRASSGMNAAETEVQLANGVVDSFAEFYDETYQGGGKLNNQEMLEYFTTHTALAIEWLSSHDIELTDLTITGGMSKKRAHRPASTAPVGAYLIKGLLRIIQKENIPLFTQVKVEHIKKNASDTEVVIRLSDEMRKTIVGKSIVIATGGFGAGTKWIKKYRPELLNYKTTNHGGATGDGLSLAQEIGAELIQMEMIQIHPTVQQDTPHAYLIGETVRGEGAILVSSEGKRFVDELDTRKVVSHAITALPGKSAYLIFDEKVRKRVKAIEFYNHIGLVESAETVAELAENLKIDSNNLTSTLAEWNKAVEAGVDTTFGRKTGMNIKLDAGPYYAIHVAPAVHYTMGGIHVDEKTRVLDGNGYAIPGIFAAGEVAGGLHGNNRIGGNSIAETVVFGRQAAQQAYVYLKQ